SFFRTTRGSAHARPTALHQPDPGEPQEDAGPARRYPRGQRALRDGRRPGGADADGAGTADGRRAAARPANGRTSREAPAPPAPRGADGRAKPATDAA